MSDKLGFYYNGSETVIAYNTEDAEKVYQEWSGEPSCDPKYDEKPEWEEVLKDRFTVSYDSIEDAIKDAPPESVKFFDDKNEKYTMTASAAQWIAHLGRNFVCTENW